MFVVWKVKVEEDNWESIWEGVSIYLSLKYSTRSIGSCCIVVVTGVAVVVFVAVVRKSSDKNDI